ncbi:hypothetical protein PGT21_020354 [Puccinia graminis f. sp. tritici]|uniref:Uncharacterized protein n=1 Tax=Puccinia graminis f. sp. tritici TaxID=56615 RepID=A0A5B0QXP5_PUCGR|nr:hypothetical protein PGT21_020354 [Puccinia graminis f. sp. tritici]KAA1138073.1 hypothetical protein PGTUg99_028569 [Puccinia graminis f. sp. tritici]
MCIVSKQNLPHPVSSQLQSGRPAQILRLGIPASESRWQTWKGSPARIYVTCLLAVGAMRQQRGSSEHFRAQAGLCRNGLWCKKEGPRVQEKTLDRLASTTLTAPDCYSNNQI